jgi:hypothetical protein
MDRNQNDCYKAPSSIPSATNITDGYGVSLGGDEHVTNLAVTVQLVNITETTEVYVLLQHSLWYMSYISIF